jgi:hypothetical protein
VCARGLSVSKWSGRLLLGPRSPPQKFPFLALKD